MAYCGPRGIRYSDFLEWPRLDRDAALAWQARQQQTCSGCGTVPADWHNAYDADGNPVVNELAPVMHATEGFCAGCAARAAHEKAVGEDRRPGAHTTFVPNPDAIWTGPPASGPPA